MRIGEKIMSFVEMLKFCEELLAVYQTLKADGTLDRIMAAEDALQKELASNAALKDLVDKVTHLKK